MTMLIPSSASAADEELVVVTGSRIPNRDYSSDSPLTTVSGDALKSTGSVEVTDLLAQLPQVVPGLSAGSNNPPSGGAQAVDLRGLGPNRNIVLMNGRRIVPTNISGTVDLQTIPTSLISRIEVITGGASAVYGADAITGVVNFIMKDNFEGVEADAQYGISDRGDDDEKSFSVTVGGNFADNRGNMVLTYDYAYRRPVFDSARPFAAQATTLTSRSPTGTYASFGGNRPSQAAVDAYFAAHGGATPGQVPNSQALGFNDDGTLFNTGGSGTAGVFNYTSNPTYPAQLFCANPASHTTCQTFSYNFQPPNLFIVPLKRQNFMGMGHFDITPDVTAYMELKFTNYSSASALAPSPAPTAPIPAASTPDGSFNGTSGYIVPTNNPFIPADLAALLASRTTVGPDVSGTHLAFNGQAATGANQDFKLVTRFSALGPRLQVLDNSIFQETFGLKGNLPWNLHFDAYASYGQVDTVVTQFGNVSNSAVERLLFGLGTGNCTGFSDFNPFGALKFGPQSLACVQRVTKNTVNSTFTNIEGDVNGQLWDLPGGTIGFSVGADYREQTYDFLADPLLASGDVSGFPASADSHGRVYDKDAYGELYLPVLKDLPWAESVSVTLGLRYTEQSNTFHGNAWTYKAEGDWAVVHGLTLRGSFEVATRMPNIGELFAGTASSAPAAADPCDFNGPFRTGPHGAQVAALCAAQGASPVGTFQQASGQITIHGSGTPTLSPETADTFTVGVAWQSTFADPWLTGLSGTLDYYNIDLHKPIGIDTYDTLYGCFNADGSNPTYSNADPACQRFSRGGQSLSLSGPTGNLYKNQTDGIDLAVNWAVNLHDTVDADPFWGDLLFNFQGTYLNSFVVQGTANGAAVDYAGTIGAKSPIGINTDGALPRYKATMTGTWNIGDASLSFRLNYVDAMVNNLALVGWEGFPFGIGPVTGTSATTYVDVFGNYAITPNITVRAGINNVADLQPRQYNPSQQDGTDPATYDIVGRRFFVGATVKF